MNTYISYSQYPSVRTYLIVSTTVKYSVFRTFVIHMFYNDWIDQPGGKHPIYEIFLKIPHAQITILCDNPTLQGFC